MNCGQQVGRDTILQDHCRRTSLECLSSKVCIIFGGEHDHVWTLCCRFDLAARVQPVHSWHPQVEHDDIGAEPLGRFDGLEAIADSPDDLA